MADHHIVKSSGLLRGKFSRAQKRLDRYLESRANLIQSDGAIVKMSA